MGVGDDPAVLVEDEAGAFGAAGFGDRPDRDHAGRCLAKTEAASNPGALVSTATLVVVFSSRGGRGAVAAVARSPAAGERQDQQRGRQRDPRRRRPHTPAPVGWETTIGAGLGGGRGKVEGERGEAPGRGDRDPPLHPLRELAGDRQAEAGPARGLRGVEALEDPSLDALGYPGSIVGDGQLCPAIYGVDGHGHARALGRVGEGVVEEDTDDLPHPFRVGGRHHRVVGGAELEPRPAEVGARPELAGHLAGELGEVDAARAHHDAAGVELGEVEQVGRQLRQAVDLLAHRADELCALLGGRVLVLEQLDEAAEAEDRRPQLVRGVGDELLAGVVELGQAALHFVEGAGQLPELAGGVDRDRPRSRLRRPCAPRPGCA